MANQFRVFSTLKALVLMMTIGVVLLASACSFSATSTPAGGTGETGATVTLVSTKTAVGAVATSMATMTSEATETLTPDATVTEAPTATKKPRPTATKRPPTSTPLPADTIVVPTDTPESISTPQPTKESGGDGGTVNDPNKVYHKGDVIIGKGSASDIKFQITLVSVKFTQNGDSVDAGDGNIYVIATFKLKNLSSSTLSVHVENFALSDQDQNGYQVARGAVRDGDLVNGAIESGANPQGMVPFKIPSTEKGLDLYFQFDPDSASNIIHWAIPDPPSS